jgi:mRNA interferase MazF
MKKGEIWNVVIPATNGHEQSGLRPVVVLSEVEVNVVLVVPFTCNVQALRFPHTINVYPTEKNALRQISVALVFQLRAIDQKRLRKKIGELEPEFLNKIEVMIRDILKL